MLDFTSSLYLGFDHDSTTLRPWKQFTTGKPAALHTLPGTRSLAADLAMLAGFEAATLVPSTLHAFWDLFGLWPAGRCAIFVDGAAYQMGRWGAARAAARGAEVIDFRHHDVAALGAALRQRRTGRHAVVLVDGYCPCCGSPAPLPDYLDLLKPNNGVLVVDDTQALGILGTGASEGMPLGRGGGGTMRWYGAKDPRAVLVASLAKGFGAPLAVVAGTQEVVERFERTSETRLHCSPVSAPALHAGEHAVAENGYRGDRVRAALCSLIVRLKTSLQGSPLRPRGGMFPVQTFAGSRTAPVGYLQKRLAAAEIETLVLRDRTSGAPRLAVMLTAKHSVRDVDRLASVLRAIEPVRESATA